MGDPLFGRSEDAFECIARPQDGDRDAGCLEPKNGGVGSHVRPATTRKARCVDVDDRDLLPARRAIDQRLDEWTRQGRGDDRQVACARGGAGLVVQEILGGAHATLLGSGERLFDGISDLGRLRPVQTVAARDVTHLKYARP